jgi:hypothetical protein
VKVELPAQPFADWLNGRVALLGVDAVVEELGLHPEHGGRYLFRWRNCLKAGSQRGVKGEYPTETFPFDTVERALEHSPWQVWDVYPWLADVDLGDEAEVRHAVATTCPICHGRKSSQANGGGAGLDRDERGHHARVYDPWENVCRCGEPKTITAARCWKCYQAAGGHKGRKHRKGKALKAITPELLAEAYGRYEDGLSLRQVAAEVFERTSYKSVTSCANGLDDAWRARGWPLRDRAQAVAAMNRARVAGMPQCEHVRPNGERCERRTMRPTGRCWHHEPERIAEGIARLRQVA